MEKTKSRVERKKEERSKSGDSRKTKGFAILKVSAYVSSVVRTAYNLLMD